MRVDDQLLLMDHSTQKRILMETEPDWSGLPCVGTTIDDLDIDALQFAKNKKADISKDESYRTMDVRTFLNQLSLLTEDGSPNNTCILFL
jgi:predicted HTH transcriptional regulator